MYDVNMHVYLRPYAMVQKFMPSRHEVGVVCSKNRSVDTLDPRNFCGQALGLGRRNLCNSALIL